MRILLICICISGLDFFRSSLEDIRPRTSSRTWSSLVRSEMLCIFGDVPWQPCMCQAKKKKRLEEMLVGAEPPIIVHVSVEKKVTCVISLCFCLTLLCEN